MLLPVIGMHSFTLLINTPICLSSTHRWSALCKHHFSFYPGSDGALRERECVRVYVCERESAYVHVVHMCMYACVYVCFLCYDYIPNTRESSHFMLILNDFFLQLLIEASHIFLYLLACILS